MNFLSLPRWQLFAVPTVLVMLAIFYVGKYFVADELLFANYHVDALQLDLQDAIAQLEAEKMQKIIAEREADVLRQANTLLRNSERKRQDEIASLKADLTFYRDLGGANGSQAPLAVHYMELQQTRSPWVYRLVFTLTQNLRWASVVSGRAQLSVDGIYKGVAAHLDDKQLLAETADPLSFQFKYFQQIERLITLPEGFEANRLTIRLNSASLRTPVEQSMQWQELFSLELPAPPLND